MNDQPPASAQQVAQLPESAAVPSDFRSLGKPKRKPRGPNLNWDEIVPKALQLISARYGHLKAARMLGVSASKLFDLLTSPKYETLYARAQVERACNVAQLAMDTVERDDLDPNDKRVRADTYKWFAARMDPARWGDRIPASVDANRPEAMTLDQLAAQITSMDGQTGLMARLGARVTTTTTQTVELAAQVVLPDPLVDDDEPL